MASAIDIQQILYGPITCHAFNKDRTSVALCPNNSEIHIYDKKGNSWSVSQVLKQHDQLVTGLDWAPDTNRIVSCGQDRNAYVWNLNGNVWEPTLVLLRLNRSATCVKWAPKENKFAVGSSAKTICICYFEQENNWWVSKQIKKPIQSTVLSIDWHPNNLLIASGSADMKARVFSAYVKDVDEKASPAPWAEGRLVFGQVLAEYDTGSSGWVHSVAFSPSGSILAWASHGSSIGISEPATGQISKVETSSLPMVTLLFASEDTIIAAGHDCYPVAFVKSGNGWKYGDKLDGGEKKSSVSTGSVAMNMFKQMDSRAQTQNGDGIQLNSVHQNTITLVRPFSGSGNVLSKFSTSGVDGNLVIWELLESSLSQLKLR